MPFAFNVVELYVVAIYERPWTVLRISAGHLNMMQKHQNLSKIIAIKNILPISISWQDSF